MYSIFLSFLLPSYCFVFTFFPLDVKSSFELIPHGRVYAEVYQPDKLDITLTLGTFIDNTLPLTCANLLLFAISLNGLPPWIFFVYFLICHVMTWVKNKAICCCCCCCCTTLTTVYTLLNSLYYTPYGILYHFEKTSNFDQEIQSHTVNQTQPTALWGRATEHL